MSTTAAPSRQLLTEADVSAITKIARGTLRNWRSARNPESPPWTRLPGGMIRYPADRLAEWLDSLAVSR